jgi:hypothetical protein
LGDGGIRIRHIILGDATYQDAGLVQFAPLSLGFSANSLGLPYSFLTRGSITIHLIRVIMGLLNGLSCFFVLLV